MLLTLNNSAGANVVYLQLDGTWSTTSAELVGGKDGSKYPANVDITFTMATGTIATNFGSATQGGAALCRSELALHACDDGARRVGVLLITES